MIRKASLLLLTGLVVRGAPLRAQDPEFRTMKAASCPAADSLVGPITKAQRRAVVRVARSSRSPGVTALSGAVRGLKPRVHALAEYPGTDPQPAPAASLMLNLPATLARATAAEHLVLLLDDSLTLDLGVPKLPREEGRIVSPVLPVVLRLTPASLASVARAGRAEVRFDSLRLELRENELADLNLFYRLARCGLLIKR